MRRFSTSYPVAGDSFGRDLDDSRDDLLPEYRRPPDWRVVAAVSVYGAVVFVVGLLLLA